MIAKDIKISKLLKDYPGSLEILLKVSPHFSKLQNKLLRKALAGRVTIEQAASIAGVNLDYLLSELNRSGSNNGNRLSAKEYEETGKDTIRKVLPASPAKPEFLKSIPPDNMSYLDVRPIIDSGRDPLKDIVSKTKVLKTGEVLIIINSFEPIPLYTVLGKKGFSYFTEQVDDYFQVYFYKERNSVPEKPLANRTALTISENDFQNIIELNVHELQPPEPMMKILENLNRVDERSVMLVRHHREPVLLYPKLEERGYYAYCKKISDENYKILIAKKKN